jgi:Zn finger protein HypA/HybF involved in hydrogenase expression
VLAISGAFVLAASAASRWRHMRAESRARNETIICRLCQHAFRHETHHGRHATVECPQCGTINDPRR